MGYRDTVDADLSAHGVRVVERQALWKIIADSFEAGGPEQVATQLKKQMGEIDEDFNGAATKLERML